MQKLFVGGGSTEGITITVPPPPPLKFARTLSRTLRLAKYGPVLVFNSEKIM